MGKIDAVLIIEILGRPVENVNEALKTIVTKLGSESGVEIKNKQYHDPKQVEGSKELFTAFAEIEVSFDALANYFGILFAYMPSHIEIIHPEKLTLLNFELNELGNSLMQRLHNYDAITKNAVAERNFLLEKLKETSPETFKQVTEQKRNN